MGRSRGKEAENSELESNAKLADKERLANLRLREELEKLREEKKEWEEKACSDIYGSIGLFTYLANEKWDEKNEKEAAFYASVASDYAVIYATVCKDE